MSGNPELDFEKRSRGIVISNLSDSEITIKRVVIYYRYTVATRKGMGIITSGTSYASKTGKEVFDINRKIGKGESIFVDFYPTDSVFKIEVSVEFSGSRTTVTKIF